MISVRFRARRTTLAKGTNHRALYEWRRKLNVVLWPSQVLMADRISVNTNRPGEDLIGLSLVLPMIIMGIVSAESLIL